MSLNFDALPDKVQPAVQPGIHKLTIDTAEAITAKTGSKMLQCSYLVDDSKFKINYDNYVITDKDGNDVEFGLSKLKHMLKAINVIPQGEFTIKSIIPLIKGKSFQANIEYDKQGKYLVLGNMSTFLPLDASGEIQTNVTPRTFVQEKLDLPETTDVFDNEIPTDAVDISNLNSKF